VRPGLCTHVTVVLFPSSLVRSGGFWFLLWLEIAVHHVRCRRESMFEVFHVFVLSMLFTRDCISLIRPPIFLKKCISKSWRNFRETIVSFLSPLVRTGRWFLFVARKRRLQLKVYPRVAVCGFYYCPCLLVCYLRAIASP
jgi:hypothetical protein